MLIADPDNLESVVNALRLLATDRDVLNTRKQLSLARAALASWKECADVFERAAGNELGALHAAAA
jgi:hypothetical protein